MFVSLANKITFFRILSVPVFILLLLYYVHSFRNGTPEELYRFLSLALFLTTISFDAIDGYIARKRNETSRLGSILDPIADKALLISSFIMLSGNPPSDSFAQLPLWFVILVISRDIVLIAGFLLINHIKGSVIVKARIPGKIATFFQTMLIIIILLKVKALPFEICLYTAAAFTLFSAVQYSIDGYHQIEDVQT